MVVGNGSGLNLLGSVRVVFGGGGSTTHDWKWLILFGWYYVIVKRGGGSGRWKLSKIVRNIGISVLIRQVVKLKKSSEGKRRRGRREGLKGRPGVKVASEELKWFGALKGGASFQLSINMQSKEQEI